MEPRKTPATVNFNGTSKGNYVEDGSIQPILPFAGEIYPPANIALVELEAPAPP